MSTEIVSNSVLPANREAVTLTTADGLVLVGELALPESKPPAATLIMVHPNPTGGGMMDSHVYRKAAWRLPALADLAILRFNTRGTSSAAGTSEGFYDEGRSEGLDLAAAIEFALSRDLPNIWLVGWSFGTSVVLVHGNVDPVQGAILLSPPLRWGAREALPTWIASGRPLVALMPEHDEFLAPAEARIEFAKVPQCEFTEVADAKHLWVGEKFVRLVLQTIVSKVRPDLEPLDWTWSGPIAKWDDLASSS